MLLVVSIASYSNHTVIFSQNQLSIKNHYLVLSDHYAVMNNCVVYYPLGHNSLPIRDLVLFLTPRKGNKPV